MTLTLNLDQLIAVGILAFISAITPGPNNLLLMAQGSSAGFKKCLPYIAGALSGCIVMFGLLSLGFGALMEALPAAALVLKWGGVLMILFLAWKVGTAPSHIQEATSQPLLGFKYALFFQWLNPKAWLLSAAVLGGAAQSKLLAADALMLALVFVVFTIPGMFTWALGGQGIGKLLDKPVKRLWFNRAAALALLGVLYPVLFS